MKERGIIMSGNNPTLILAGDKIETRRMMVPQPPKEAGEVEAHDTYPGEWFYWLHAGERSATFECPYGEIGDRLWVRETHYAFGWWTKNGLTKTGKQAWKFHHDRKHPIRFPGSNTELVKGKKQRGYFKRVSIHMPRWASRILLEITDLGSEPLQNLTDSGAKAEGFGLGANIKSEKWGRYMSAGQYAYVSLFESLHGEGIWRANPRVWVIRFKKL